ncbi:MAG: hypothetical protein M3N49_05950 [Candidatus Eremiobacteraeota bacterium]|nr:hypothetical protein [Candidatus Eremiobacteraeota bacterium]
MKLAANLIILCALASVTLAAASDVAQQRDQRVSYLLGALKSTNSQLETFGNDLAAEKATKTDLEVSATRVEATATALKTDFKDLSDRNTAYVAKVQAHNARCPRESPDAALVSACNEQKAQLDTEHDALKTDTTAWTARKDGLLKRVEQLDADQRKNARNIQYFEYSISSLKAAKQRILDELGRIRKAIDECRQSIKAASLEQMHAVCGQPFDGNAIH